MQRQMRGYRAVRGSRFTNADAKKIAPVLAQIVKDNPDAQKEDVLKEAQKRRSPLHPYLNWNDKKAAKAHRLQQVGEMIRSIEIEFVERSNSSEEWSPYRLRAFHCIEFDWEGEEEEEESGIRPRGRRPRGNRKRRKMICLDDTADDDTIVEAMMQQMLQELRHFSDRFEKYSARVPRLKRESRTLFNALRRLLEAADGS